MKHSWLKRAVCLLLAAQCAISIPASTMIEAAAIEADNAAAAEGDAFSTDGVIVEEAAAEDSAAQDTASEEETVISYVDIDGNYNAPEELTVYITRLAEEGKVQDPTADSKYTGVVAFYDYNEDRVREEPFFFYYEKGKLQSDELRFAAAKSYLDLVNPPVSESVMTGVAPSADEVEEKVYAAEEVYVDEEAQEHQEYLFAFNQDASDNGLYTGQVDGQVYQNGLLTAAEDGGAVDPEGGSGESAEGTEGTEGSGETDQDQTPEEEVIQQAGPATTTEQKAGGIQVSWTQVENATGYRVLRKAADELEWTAVADLTGGDQISYLDESAQSDKTYTYAVRAYFGEKTGTEREEETGSLWTGYQESAALYYLAAPVVTNIYNIANGLVLRWSKVTGATNYTVYRKTADSDWEALKTVASSVLTYTDTDVEQGTKYLYTVRAVNGSIFGEFYDYTGDTSKYVTLYGIPSVTLANQTEGQTSGVLVKWTPDAAATGYRVFRKATTDSYWAIAGDVEDGEAGSWLDSGAVSGKTYVYTVRAYYGTEPMSGNTAYTTSVWSSYTSSSKLYYLQAPTLTTVFSFAGGMSVQWAPVSGATSYTVWRKTATSGWTLLATVTGASAKTYNDKTVVADTEYFYTVRAVNGSEKSWFITPEAGWVYHAPLSVNVRNDGSEVGAVELAWTKTAGATGYRVFRKAEGETAWTIIANLTDQEAKNEPAGNAPADDESTEDGSAEEGSTEVTLAETGESDETEAPAEDLSRVYNDFNVVHGKKYTYAVRAYFGAEDITTVTSYGGNQWSNFVEKTILRLTTPALGECLSVATGMSVTWTPVTGATSYVIYRKTASSGWSQVGEVTGEAAKQYTDTTAVNGTEYFYTVRAKVKNSDITVVSGFITPEKGYVYHAPLAVTVSNSDAGLKLTWTADTGATGYRVFRKLSTESGWSVIANLSSDVTTYVETTLMSGAQGSYAVRAYFGTDDIAEVTSYGGNQWSNFIAKTCTYLTIPLLTSETGENVSTGIKITWEKVTGATGYTVWRKDLSAEKPSWGKVASVTGGSVTSYIDTSKLTVGHLYCYTVRATAADGTISWFDSVGTVTKYLPAPENLFVDRPASTGTAISWNQVTGADSYTVWRKAPGGYWTKIATVDTNAYLDIEVTNTNTAYYYTVRAVSTVTVGEATYTFNGAYDNVGVTFAVKWSGSERNTWVFKNGNQYFVNSKGYCLTGWNYVKRNGKEYKYYFELDTGKLCTNLYQRFGSSYADMRCKFYTYINKSNSNPSHTTILLYDAEKSTYCIPAITVRCVAGMDTTPSGYFYLQKGSGQRWLTNEELVGAAYEQYAVYVKGSGISWYHSALYRSQSYKNFMSSTYNSLARNKNNSLGCIRFQAIHSYLICDIMKNGYGASNKVHVEVHKNSSVKSPFGTPKINTISSRKTDPSDPAVTGKFYYATSIFGVKSKAGASSWTYYT